MSGLPTYLNGVPQYPKANAGRLFVTLAAIDFLDRPTVISVALHTGLNKNAIQHYVDQLNNEYGVVIVKELRVFRIESWGSILNKAGVQRCLTTHVKDLVPEHRGHCERTE